MDFGEMFQEGTIAEPQPGPGAVDVTGGGGGMGGGDFSGMMTPMPEIEAAHIPAKTPQEIEKRKMGWKQVWQAYESNPNLQRALFLVGAQLAQPIQPGQTTGGAIANAGVVGLNAYQMGQTADLQRQAAARKEGREERQLNIGEEDLALRKGKAPHEIRSLEAGTAGREAQTDVTRAEGKLKWDTIDDAVASSRVSRRKLELALTEAEKDVALKELQRDNDAIKAFAERPEIMNNVRRDIELNEAKLGQMKAGTRKAGADARQTELTTEAIMGLSEAEQKDWLLKRGKYSSGGQTAVDRNREVYGQIYDALPADDPQKRGKTKEQFLLGVLQAGKMTDAVKAMSDYVTAMDRAGMKPDPEMLDIFTNQIRAQRGTGSSAAPTGGRRSVTMAEVKQTAKARGISEKQVLDALKAKGISVQ